MDRLDLQVVIVYVGKRDVWEWLHVDTSEGGAVMSRCGFRSVRYLEVKIRNTAGIEGITF